MPIQILHAADFHLDAPFASLNAEQAAEALAALEGDAGKESSRG